MKLTQLPVCTELFHTAAGTAYADLVIDGHRETWPIRSRRFRAWLRRSYYEATGTAASAVAIESPSTTWNRAMATSILNPVLTQSSL
jgi:hypothetical protein